MYLLYEVPEEDGLLSQGIMNQALREEYHPMGEIVLRQPGYHTLLLHVRAPSDVNDQISQVLPMSACKCITSKVPHIYSVWSTVPLNLLYMHTHTHSVGVT